MWGILVIMSIACVLCWLYGATQDLDGKPIHAWVGYAVSILLLTGVWVVAQL